MDFLLSIYVDDLGVVSGNVMDLIFDISTDLGNILGMIFKAAKDQRNTTRLTYIGFEIDTTPPVVTTRVPRTFVTEVDSLI